MSLQRYDRACFRGWRGPFYPSVIRDLAVELDAVVCLSGHVLDGIVSGMPGRNRRIDDRKSTDGYVWFWLIQCSAAGGGALIAIPWAQDWERTDGVGFDRSPALYLKGWTRDRAGETIVTNLTQAVRARKRG